MKEKQTYLIIKENRGDGSKKEIEEIVTYNEDDVFKRIAQIMEESDCAIHIWKKEDYLLEHTLDGVN